MIFQARILGWVDISFSRGSSPPRNQTRISCIAGTPSVVTQLCSTLCNPTARLLHPCDSPGKNTGVGWHFLLQLIFPTQESNPDLLHCRHTFWATREDFFLVKWLSKILTCFSFLELVLGESVCFLHIESFYFNGYQSLSGICFSNVFLILWLIHLFSNSVFWSTEIFNFYKVLFSTFFLIWVMLLLSNLRSLCLYKLCHNFLLFYSKRFTVLGFTFSLESILSLIFVYGGRYWLRLFFAHVYFMCKKLVQYYLLKRLYFTELSLHLCWKLIVYIQVGIFLKCLFFLYYILLFLYLYASVTLSWLV